MGITRDEVDAYWRQYLRHYGLGSTPTHVRNEADDADRVLWQVAQDIRAGGPEAVDAVVALAAAAPTDEALSFLGAGPLEELVNWHGVSLMDELDRALDAEPRLCVALSYVRVGVETLTPETRLSDFFHPKRDEKGTPR